MQATSVGASRQGKRWRKTAVGAVATGVAATVIALVVAGSARWAAGDAEPSCEELARAEEYARAAELCLARYRKSGDALELIWAARARVSLGLLDEARILAREAIDSAHYGEAHGVLGYLAMREGIPEAAKIHAQASFAAHLRSGDRRAQASALTSLSQAAWQAGDYTVALDTADRALAMAEELGGFIKVMPIYTARVDALRRMGDHRRAATVLREAIQRVSTPCDRTWLQVKQGMVQLELAQPALAELELETAAKLNEECGSPDVKVQILLNQASLLMRTKPSISLARLVEAEAIRGEVLESQLLHGYLAANRGAFAEAERHFQRAAQLGPPDAAWAWELAWARAELFEQRGGVIADALAALFYRSATEMVANLRRGARERSALLVASHRGPYDGLIALWARHRRWREALAVVLELDASDMLRATANESLARDHSELPTGMRAAMTRSVATAMPGVDAVLEAWRGRELAIVVAREPRQIGSGSERAYRLLVRGGEVTGEDVGRADEARGWARELFANLGDVEAARRLGPMFVPSGGGGGGRSGSGRGDGGTSRLDVLTIGPLGKVPLAALRWRDGELISARRPLVRVLALRAAQEETVDGGGSVVLSDPRGDLPHAAIEGGVVVEALRAEEPTRSLRVFGTATGAEMPMPTDGPATPERLWEATGAGLLHVAGHVGTKGRWRALLLAGGEVDPSQIVQRQLAPRIAVLASCGSAAATDEEGWGSIAAALLEAGTTAVVATDRSVKDEEALLMMRSFYAQPDWRADPARALSRVQSKMSDAAARGEAGGVRAWAAFSVLGRPPVVR